MKNYRCPLCQLPNSGKSHRVGGVWRCPKRMTLAQEAERFRNIRTTIEAIVTAPDFAEKIAERQEPNGDAFSMALTRADLFAYGAACAREGYNLGIGVQS